MLFKARQGENQRKNIARAFKKYLFKNYIRKEKNRRASLNW